MKARKNVSILRNSFVGFPKNHSFNQTKSKSFFDIEDNDFTICFAKILSICFVLYISVEKRVPWIGTGVGFFFGVIIVISDFFTKTPTLAVRAFDLIQLNEKQTTY